MAIGLERLRLATHSIVHDVAALATETQTTVANCLSINRRKRARASSVSVAAHPRRVRSICPMTLDGFKATGSYFNRTTQHANKSAYGSLYRILKMPLPKDDPKSPEWRPYIFAGDE